VTVRENSIENVTLYYRNLLLYVNGEMCPVAYMRMDIELFKELLSMVEPLIQRNDART